MSYFTNQASGAPHNLLSALEGSMMLMGDEDQGFVRGCRQHLNEGAVLTADNVARLQRIAASVGGDGIPNMGGIATSEPELSTLKVFRDLAGAKHTLNVKELRFANLMAKKYTQKTPLTTDEMQKLMTLYTLKGF